MQRVFVLDKNKEPLMPCHPARARELLRKGSAAVFRRYPFTIILKERQGGDVQPVQVKLDPGSKTTGIALVADSAKGKEAIWAAELTHRGQQIKAALLSRRQLRSTRRSRKTRYRKPRFDNRTRPEGWLPPSLMSRVYNIQTWVRRLSRFCPVAGISLELVRFDMQAMQNPEISGVEYQQGELAGYEVREYLLEKWGRQCAYCDADNVPLQVEHIQARAKGGSNRVSNLTLACESCNRAKGTQEIKLFLSKKPEKLERILRQTEQPLKDAAAVNATRQKVFDTLKTFGLPIEVGTGGRTKYNRVTQGYPKAHWIDAACVGQSGGQVYLIPDTKLLQIKATGHGSRQMCRTDKYGFPSRYRLRQKTHFSFKTGDIVQAIVKKGKYMGLHIGRVACRATGSFDLPSAKGISYRYCTIIHKGDGYSYA